MGKELRRQNQINDTRTRLIFLGKKIPTILIPTDGGVFEMEARIKEIRKKMKKIGKIEGTKHSHTITLISTIIKSSEIQLKLAIYSLRLGLTTLYFHKLNISTKISGCFLFPFNDVYVPFMSTQFFYQCEKLTSGLPKLCSTLFVCHAYFTVR